MASSSGKLWSLRIVLFGSVLLSLLAVAGASYQTITSRADAQRFRRAGQLASAGKIRLNLYCTGQGSPTVVLEAGWGDSLDSWRRVQPAIARFARVCSYDRAGYGYSDPGPMPRTSDRIASELHTALRSAGEKPPYLLVGHSFGGFNIRVFNGKYSDQIAGLVLVDTTQEDQYHVLPRAWANIGAAIRRRAQRQAFWAPLYIDLGIARLQLRMQGHQVSPVLLQSKYLKARADELENIEVSAEQARTAGHIDDKPLLVLTAGRAIDATLKAVLSENDQRSYEETWINDLQLRLAQLSTRGKRVVVPDSGHDIPSDRPEVIVAAVRELCALHNHAVTREVFVVVSPIETKRNPRDGLVYVWIPPGISTMGCSPEDAECFGWEPTSHQVRIERGFWIGQTEVTQKAYSTVIGTNLSRYRGSDLPVDQVSWFNARRYCEAVGMRLPTEAEWEYAARGGTTGARYDLLDAIAWYDGNSKDQTHPVAEKKANAFGLYDMLGNVWEWVQDRYGEHAEKRILRGGSFYNLPRDLRVSNRLWALPETDHRNMGVRCVGN